jgi:hypothetical protein
VGVQREGGESERFAPSAQLIETGMNQAGIIQTGIMRKSFA